MTGQEGLTVRPDDILQDIELIHTRTNDLLDRRSAAADAKAALLQSYRARMAADEPTRLARLEERRVVAVAREERRAQRDRLKREAHAQEQRRVEAEAAEQRAAADAVAEAEKARRETVDSLIARAVKDEAQRKAERDRRYANRKARQK